jgi:hypothetical protein
VAEEKMAELEYGVVELYGIVEENTREDEKFPAELV